jgi:hypothetical protein
MGPVKPATKTGQKNLGETSSKLSKEIHPNVMVDLACLSSRTRSVLKYMVKRNDFQSSFGNHPITNGKRVSTLPYRHRGPVAIQ